MAKKYSTVIHLYYYEGYSLREIAGILRKPQGTVAWCYRTAIRKLREVQL